MVIVFLNITEGRGWEHIWTYYSARLFKFGAAMVSPSFVSTNVAESKIAQLANSRKIIECPRVRF